MQSIFRLWRIYYSSTRRVSWPAIGCKVLRYKYTFHPSTSLHGPVSLIRLKIRLPSYLSVRNQSFSRGNRIFKGGKCPHEADAAFEPSKTDPPQAIRSRLGLPTAERFESCCLTSAPRHLSRYCDKYLTPMSTNPGRDEQTAVRRSEVAIFRLFPVSCWGYVISRSWLISYLNMIFVNTNSNT